MLEPLQFDISHNGEIVGEIEVSAESDAGSIMRDLGSPDDLLVYHPQSGSSVTVTPLQACRIATIHDWQTFDEVIHYNVDLDLVIDAFLYGGVRKFETPSDIVEHYLARKFVSLPDWVAIDYENTLDNIREGIRFCEEINDTWIVIW